jgi:Xaa-Pro aminopeptidase
VLLCFPPLSPVFSFFFRDFSLFLPLSTLNRLRSIISDLRKSWEEEEVARIKQAEEKIRANYSIVLEHIESQLHMSLQLQDDADRKWFDELEDRNKKQLETIRMFENKCKKLYETRLIEYAEKTCAQIASYEEKLLEVRHLSLASLSHSFPFSLFLSSLSLGKWSISSRKESI